MWDQLAGDVRFALRTLRRAPGFVLVALLTLTVGIAAVTTIFSFANAVYIRPLPYPDSHRIVAVGEERPRGYRGFSSVSPPAVSEILHADVFERVSAYQTTGSIVLIGSEPRSVSMMRVDTAFVRLLQLRAQLGRTLAADDILGDAPLAMISDNLWRAQFGADSGAIGKPLTLLNRQFTIVGVLAPGFRFPWQTDAWIPLPNPILAADAEDNTVTVLARLRAGVTQADARAAMQVVAQRLQAADPAAHKGLRILVRDEMLDRRSNQFMPVPSLFFGAAFLVLLVACSNVANLFLARAAEREAEMAIRGALGAGRGRLVRQVLTEGVLLGLAAAASGTLLSVWLVKLALSLIPTQGFPSWVSFALDVRMLLFSIALAFLVAILVALSPAFQGTRFELTRALKAGGTGGSASRRVRRGARRGLVIQLALAVVLFVGATLLLRSYRQLLSVDVGYPAGRIALVQTIFDRTRYPDAESRARVIEGVFAQARDLPGARTAAIRGYYGGSRDVATGAAEDRPDNRLFVDGDTNLSVTRGMQPYPRLFAVSDDYFKLLELRVLRGRSLGAEDVAGSAPVAAVSRRFAEQVWRDADPIGRTLQTGATGRRYTVVGVVSDVRDVTGGRAGMSAAPRTDVYFSTRQAMPWQPEILARGDGDVATLRSAIVAFVRAADPTLMVLRYETLASQLDEMFLVTRVLGGLIGTFALTALLLAVVGVYGVVAYGIAQRTREIGIRMALGGGQSAVLRMVLSEGLRFVLVGVGIGLLLAMGATRVLRVLLFGVSPLDPVAYAAAAVFFGAVALAACWLPARRVARVDPLIALRAE